MSGFSGKVLLDTGSAVLFTFTFLELKSVRTTSIRLYYSVSKQWKTFLKLNCVIVFNFQVLLQNPSTKPLVYQVLLAGRDASDFHPPMNKSNQKSPPSPPSLSRTLQFYAQFLEPVFPSKGGEIEITDIIVHSTKLLDSDL